MGALNNSITIDNPNVPILSPATARSVPFGKFLPVDTGDYSSYENAVTVTRASDMYLPNFSLRLFEGKFVDDAVFINQSAQGTDLLGSCLFFKGNVKSTLHGKSYGPESYNWSQNFKFDPHNEFLHHCPAGSELSFIHFSYTSDYFGQFLPDDQQWAVSLREKISKKERILGDHFSAITLIQQQALRNVLNCPLEGKLGYMMIETSIIQIILIQMHSLFHKEEAFKQPVANRRDTEIIQQLKEHLTKTFLDEHCLSTLARQFGTNTNKLMTLFKKIFGKSIFEFIGELRMNHAMDLLREHGLLVTEVARVVGYKNPNHFSIAFKRKFGISPSDLK
jgi:AraC-like DNA-binding protein